jgi:hypothetical protein
VVGAGEDSRHGICLHVDGRTVIERDRAAFVKQVGCGGCTTVLMT